MKKTTKRLLALVLCAVLGVGLLPAGAADLWRRRPHNITFRKYAI